MADPFSSNASTPTSFGRKGAVVAPSDTADLATIAKAVVVCTAGNLAIVPAGNADNEIITFTGCPIGFVPPYIVRRVRSTGTTATVATVDS
jgi:hypothetical protein